MDFAASLLAIRVLTDAVHNNIDITWDILLSNGQKKNIFPQVIAWVFALGFTVLYGLAPLPPVKYNYPFLNSVDTLLNALVLWIGAMGTDDLLKKLRSA